MDGVSPHMEFVDNAVLHGHIEGPIALPVEIIGDHTTTSGKGGIFVCIGRWVTPSLSAFKGLGIGVQEYIIFVEPVPGSLGVKGPVGTVPVTQGCVHTHDKHMPNIPGPVDLGIQGDFSNGLMLALAEKNQAKGCGVSRKDRKIHPLWCHGST
jgi:hypothetical protein